MVPAESHTRVEVEKGKAAVRRAGGDWVVTAGPGQELVVRFR